MEIDLESGVPEAQIALAIGHHQPPLVDPPIVLLQPRLALGYSIAFGDGGGANAVWGGLGKMFLIGIGPDTLSGTIPEVLFFAFQMTFAIITPALIVGPIGALVIGAVAGVQCQIAVNLVKQRFRIDDTLDVFAVHGVGGIFGTLMAPILAVGALSDGQGLATQLIALASVGVFTVVVTFALVKLSGLVCPMRVTEEDEFDGLYITAHGERAYDLTS